MFTSSSRLRQRGVSLVELVMFIVIISISVIGVVRVLSLTTVMSADPIRLKQALAIAETLLEEVQLARFTFCDGLDGQAENATSAVVGANGVGCSTGLLEAAGQEPGGVARPFDNVSDYANNGYGVPSATVLQNGANALANANGVAIPGGYGATVTITPTDTLGGISSSGSPVSTEVLRITVTVTYENNQSVTLDGYRTRYAPTSMP
jgi:MSHA pilin protein MshD